MPTSKKSDKADKPTPVVAVPDPRTPGYDPHFDPSAPQYDPRYHPEDPTRHQHSAPTATRSGKPSAEARESAARGVKGEFGDYPKPLVRVKPGGTGPGGYDAEVRLVADDDGLQVAKDEGFAEVEQPDRRVGFVEYPKWKYHSDGGQQVVHTQEAEEKLDGYEDVPPEPEGEDGEAGVPPPSSALAMGAAQNRPPVPPDRG